MAIKSSKLGPGTLTFGETGSELEWGAQVRSCTVEPTSEDGDVLPVLSGEEITEDDDDGFELTGEVLQSYDVRSLSVWCHLNHNAKVPFRFRPRDDEALGVTGTVTVKRIAIGGNVKERNTSEFTFRGDGMFQLVDSDDTPITSYAPEPGTGE